MQASVRTATVVGVQAVPVDVEADVASGLPCFSIVGLGDAAVMEARDRVRSAVRASGFDFPNARVTVNLAPAPLRKHGTGFDLPVALAILKATRQVPPAHADGFSVAGELGLDGSLRPIAGLLAFAMDAHDSGLGLLGPPDGAGIAAHLPGLRYAPLARLADVRSSVRLVAPSDRRDASLRAAAPDLADVAGHGCAKRALEIAAAGGHNVLLVGPPGCGKTMLARRLPGILPPLTPSERLSTALVHSVAGLDERPALAGVRPFRAPHHTASVAGLAGGGSPPRPGEVSLAHNGVLFLDELAEFGPAALQALRQPMEDGVLTLVRAEGRVRYPARFTLVAAMNPCPCGSHGDPDRDCTCTLAQIGRYTGRVGGPLLDRIDIRLRVARPDPALLLGTFRAEPSRSVAERVSAARERAEGRLETNDLAGAALLGACRVTPSAVGRLEHDAAAYRLSGRSVTRLLRVARTIADLDGSAHVAPDHLAEAVSYRLDSS